MTMVEIARIKLKAKNLKNELLAQPMKMSCHFLTRAQPICFIVGHKVFIGRKSDVSYLRVFGNKYFVHISFVDGKNLDEKNKTCNFLIFVERENTYYTSKMNSNKLIINKYVIFDENNSSNERLKNKKYQEELHEMEDVSHWWED